MTIEEAIKDLHIHNCGLCLEPFCKKGCSVDMAISALKSQRWIPVTERLPEYDNVYLVYDLHDGLSMMEYHTSDDGSAYYGKGFYSSDENGYMWKNDKVTHWMPLPKPPKEEQK